MSSAELNPLLRFSQDGGTAHTYCRAMKRKEVECPAFSQRSKRRDDTATSIAPPESPLVTIFQQYGLLEAVVSNIHAHDLLALALTSKTLHKAIASCPESMENLLGRVRCSGMGVQIRAIRHQNSTYTQQVDTYHCTEYVVCGSATHRYVESQPCITCQVATCDECRIHVVYQSIYQPPDDPDDPAELPNFSGFVLLCPDEQAILSPHHLPSGDSEELPRWRDPSLGQGGPYHDQGILDTPIESTVFGAPECIEDILDLDLGLQSLKSTSRDSRYGSPSPVLWSLSNVVEKRKIRLCTTCIEHCDAKKRLLVHEPHRRSSRLSSRLPTPPDETPLQECHCTLRERFLDRWLCLQCYLVEESAMSLCSMSKTKRGAQCSCTEPATRVLCLWCRGEVMERDD